jgi:hypothetical protein
MWKCVLEYSDPIVLRHIISRTKILPIEIQLLIYDFDYSLCQFLNYQSRQLQFKLIDVFNSSIGYNTGYFKNPKLEVIKKILDTFPIYYFKTDLKMERSNFKNLSCKSVKYLIEYDSVFEKILICYYKDTLIKYPLLKEYMELVLCL